MKSLSKLVALATGTFTLALVAFSLSPVFAGSPGQLAQGSGLYLVKNLTQSGSYASTVNTNAGDEVQYSMELSNTGFGGLNNVTVNATFPSAGGTSTFTATTDLGGTSGTSDSVSVVSIPGGQSIAYEAGTTVLYDGNGHAIQTLPDGVTSGNVNIGTINGSTTEFVNFKAKVSSPAPVTYTSTQTATATATASATATCPPNQGGDTATVSATGSATATANATSNVSQADADQKAHNAALAAATPNAQANAQANANVLAVASVKCSSAVVTTISTPPVNKTLPNTGPGDVFELFAGATGLGSVGHYFVNRRRR